MTTYRKTLCKVTMILITLTLAFTMATDASADYIYTYTGALFASDSDDFPGTDPVRITGSLTFTNLPTLAATLQDVNPSSYSFSDGARSFSSTDTSPYSLTIQLAGTGADITGWNLILSQYVPAGSSGPNYAVIYARSTPDNISRYDRSVLVTYSSEGPLHDYQAHTDSQGSWTGPVSTVPEPATMLLLGSGLIGLVGLRRRFKK